MGQAHDLALLEGYFLDVMRATPVPGPIAGRRASWPHTRERWPARLVATAAEDRLLRATDCRTIAIY